MSKSKIKKIFRNPSNLLQLEKMLISLLGTKVVINKNKNGRGKINIEFYSESDLQRVLEIITESDE